MIGTRQMGEWCWSGLNHTLLNQSVVVNAPELEALKRGVHTAGKQTPKIMILEILDCLSGQLL